MTPEQRLYNRLSSWCKSNLPRGRYVLQRIETSTAVGIPDVYFCTQGKSCWLETKTLDYQVDIYQSNWAWKHQLAGGVTWIVTEIDNELVGLKFEDTMVDYSSLGVYVNAFLPEKYSLERVLLG